MPRTFADSLAYDRDNVFHNTNEFGTSATLTTPGVGSSTIAGLLMADDLSNLQGLVLDDANGKRETQFALFRTKDSYSIVTADYGQNCSTLTIDGETWQCVRIVSKAGGEQIIAIRRELQVATRLPKTSRR